MKPLWAGWLLAASLAAPAAERVTPFASFCAGCGIWGADTFVSHSKQFVVHGSAAPGTILRETGANA